MNFDRQSYRQLIGLLTEQHYEVVNYRNYRQAGKCVILRHDIDLSLPQALRMAALEQELGVSSTYFVLVTGDFYNPASQASRKILHAIGEMGHEIGLHFDETAYGSLSPEACVRNIMKERDILSEILGTEITAVSMHRPSRAMLEADLQIPGMINSYSREFFKGFKYLSDSRRRWREPAEEIIRSGEYRRLHILTHAFWYHEQDESIEKAISDFVHGASTERYNQLTENITDLPSIMSRKEL